MTSLTLTTTSARTAAPEARAAAPTTGGLRRRVAAALALPALAAGLLLSVALYAAPVVAVALLVL